jgi:hypothetical protein
MNNHRFWIKAAAVLQILTATAHSLSFFTPLTAENETEKQLISLFTTYRRNMGGGFAPTMFDLFTALSSCFALLYFFGGVLLFYLLRRNVDAGTMKGVLNISILIFGVCFGIMALLTFPPPILLTGLSFVLLVVSRFTAGRA